MRPLLIAFVAFSGAALAWAASPATKVTALDLKTREDASRPEFVTAIENARAIFFGGGDQVRVTNTLLDTPAGDAIVAAFERGAVVGGTPAGTACRR